MTNNELNNNINRLLYHTTSIDDIKLGIQLAIDYKILTHEEATIYASMVNRAFKSINDEGYKRNWGDGYIWNKNVILLMRENIVQPIISSNYTRDYILITSNHNPVTIKGSTSYGC